ncbi:MAG: hypothetical protein AB1696_23140 [Planctomycetota bacterium]
MLAIGFLIAALMGVDDLWFCIFLMLVGKVSLTVMSFASGTLQRAWWKATVVLVMVFLFGSTVVETGAFIFLKLYFYYFLTIQFGILFNPAESPRLLLFYSSYNPLLMLLAIATTCGCFAYIVKGAARVRIVAVVKSTFILIVFAMAWARAILPATGMPSLGYWFGRQMPAFMDSILVFIFFPVVWATAARMLLTAAEEGAESQAEVKGYGKEC